jgi:two-component system, LytTR family, response regulator LytT
MNILIVEDEQLAVKKLQRTLASVDEDANVIGVTNSIRSTVDWINNNPAPDLILMDIELADGQSFEVFHQVEVSSSVIFITSYDEFALKAFKVNSVDYLLKPIKKEDLQTALEKFRHLKKIYAPQPAVTMHNLEGLLKQLHNKVAGNSYRKRFLVKNASRLVSVNTDEVAYLFTEGRLAFFKTTANKKFIVDYNMDELEEMLDPAQFFRINRSIIVSLDSITAIEDYFGNRLALKLAPGLEKEVIVSREKVAEFKKWMGK